MKEPRFTDAEKDTVLAGASPLERFLAVWVVLLERHDLDLQDENLSIAPWDYQLHRDDATWAMEQIMALEPDPTGRALWRWSGPTVAPRTTRRRRDRHLPRPPRATVPTARHRLLACPTGPVVRHPRTHGLGLDARGRQHPNRRRQPCDRSLT